MMPDWSQAACRGKPVEWFVPPVAVREDWRRRRRLAWLSDFVARVEPICAACPIARECEAWGLEHEAYGAIYGGRLIVGVGVERQRHA